MIRKNDILVYAECLEEGDENCLMIALEDECTPAKVPMVKTRELNTNLACPPVNFFETKYYSDGKWYPRGANQKIPSAK